MSMRDLQRDEEKIIRKGRTFRTQREKNIRAFRTEASRLVSMANKRLRRLEARGLEDSPAYESAMNMLEGRTSFGIRGMEYNDVQKEFAMLNRFLDSATSTIRGSNRILKEMASNTGLSYQGMSDLREMAKPFFKLSSMIEQYLRTTNDSASAIGYQQIWEQINQYIEENNIELSNIESDEGRIEHLTSQIVNEINKHEDYKVKGSWYELEGWYQLPNDKKR